MTGNKALQELYNELDRTSVISKEFKNRIVALVITAINTACEEESKRHRGKENP